ncbi:MAG: N-6 DNA methylase [Phycisphaeraceae bacterium]|nr:N-6 DNA methylase [Phycisphaeraceae bacterium]
MAGPAARPQHATLSAPGRCATRRALLVMLSERAGLIEARMPGRGSHPRIWATWLDDQCRLLRERYGFIHLADRESVYGNGLDRGVIEECLAWGVKGSPTAEALLLGLEHERSVDSVDRRRARKDRGVYYTPRALVDHLLERTIRADTGVRWADGSPYRVFDPACGAGFILVEAYRALLDSCSWDDAPLTLERRTRILGDCIFGLDIDPVAVEVTRFALLVSCLGVRGGGDRDSAAARKIAERLRHNIRIGDALLDPDWPGDEPVGVDGSGEHWSRIMSGPFDLVIGNPPYRSFSGRHSGSLSHAHRDYFARRYITGRRPTLHGLFLERSLRHWSRSMVAMVLPGQVGHLDAYAPLRGLVEQFDPTFEIRHWGESMFRDAITPIMTLIARREGRPSLRTPSVEPPPTDSPSPTILAKAQALGRSLGELVADPGVHTGNCAGKLIRAMDDQKDGQWVPVLEGKRIERYGCRGPNRWLRVDYPPAEGEYFRIAAQERFEAARFVIRQTAGFPIVGPRLGVVYFRNSLLALYSPAPPLDVRYFVGLLNSRLIRWLYRCQVHEAQQKAFPQVKVRSLRALRVHWPAMERAEDRKRHDAMVKLVQTMLDLKAQATESSSLEPCRSVHEQMKEIDDRIDRLVYGIYGLSDSERMEVERTTEG